MKRNIIAISLMAAGLFTFGNVYAEETTISNSGCDAKTYVYQAELNNGKYLCGKTINTLVENENFDGGEITVLKNIDYPTNGSATFKKDATFNLNGHTVKFTGASKFIIDSANVTIKNGKITAGSDATAMFEINDTDEDVSLTIADSIKINATDVDGLTKIIDIKDSTKNKVTINVNGDWNIPGEIVDCTTGDEDGNITVNLNATITSAGQLVSIEANTSTINILGGNYTSTGKDAIMLQNGTLNISGGTITANNGNVINVKGSAVGKTEELNITGGNLVAKGTSSDGASKYAIKFNGGTEDGTYKFAGGTYTSGKNSKGEFQPAMYINDTDFLDKQQGIITGGTYNNGIVADTKVGNDVYQSAASAIKTLVASNLDYTEGEDGTITVAPAKPEEQPTNPGQTGSQAGSDDGSNTGDNTIDDSPQTYDGIMSYVTMAITSVGAVALSLKKVLSR